MSAPLDDTTLRDPSIPGWYPVIEGAYWLLALTLGAIQAWIFRYQPSSPDAVSYLDIADAYLHGHWAQGLNGYWNPLYSWLLAATLGVTRPSGQWEYPAAKALDFAIYVSALLSFRWFLRQLRTASRVWGARESSEVIPDWMWIVVGYTLFIWSSIRWIRVTSNTPDMLGAALAYLSWGLFFRLQVRERPRDYWTLGAALALGYYARTPMLVVGAAFLVSMALQSERAGRRTGVVTAASVLLLLTLPFIMALSLSRGRLTIGDNARLNHAWLANPGRYVIPDTNWQGGPTGYGTPRHPTRQVWNAPPTFEFATPIGGTYPPWTDPSYWYEGLTYHFSRAAEWTALKDNLLVYYGLFFKWLVISGAAALLIIGDARATFRAVWRNAAAWVPPVVGLATYLIANDLRVQRLPAQPWMRYVAIHIMLLSMVLASCLRLRLGVSSISRRIAGATAVAVSVFLLATLIVDERRELANPFDPRIYVASPPWEQMRFLEQAGIAPGSRIAIIGEKSRHVYWAVWHECASWLR